MERPFRFLQRPDAGRDNGSKLHGWTPAPTSCSSLRASSGCLPKPSRGERVLVSNGIVFWYEDDGGIGWQVKETSSTRESDGATVWKEGTIRSTNHGRLVILPYINEDGEQVRGHKKMVRMTGVPCHAIPTTMSISHSRLTTVI